MIRFNDEHKINNVWRKNEIYFLLKYVTKCQTLSWSVNWHNY